MKLEYPDVDTGQTLEADIPVELFKYILTLKAENETQDRTIQILSHGLNGIIEQLACMLKG